MAFKFQALFIVFLFALDKAYSAKSHFTLTAPRTIRSNSEYFVAISFTGNSSSSASFNISVYSYCKKAFLEAKVDAVVELNSTKLVKMIIPRLMCKKNSLKMIFDSKTEHNQQAELQLQAYDYTVYIQTDKALYKPSEIVEFRVICIDHLTRPAKVMEVLDVFIYDGEKNLIKKFPNVKLVQGVFRDKLKLAEYIVLGDWQIEVKADEITMQKKTFIVDEYELKRFSVEILTKSNVVLENGQIVIDVESMYTYKQPVAGNLSVTLALNYSFERKRMKAITKYSSIDGKAAISFNLDSNFDSKFNSYIQYKLTVTANVTNSLTGKLNSTSIDINVYTIPYRVELRAPKFNNPGENITVSVSVKDVQGNPVWDEENPVRIIMGQTDESTPNFLRCYDPYNASDTGYLNSNGVATFTLQYPINALVGDYGQDIGIKAEYLSVTTDWEDLSENFLNVFNLDVLTEKPEVGKELLINILSKDPIHYFIYEIVSRGDIIQTERILVPRYDTKYLLKLNATFAMVPKIIFYMHRIIGSVMDFQFIEIPIKRNFQNSILIAAESQAKPGDTVSINVTTDPNSYIGLMGIDERLLLLTNRRDDLNEDNVYSNIRTFYNINMKKSIYPGSEVGLFTFSNAFNRAGDGIGVSVKPRMTEKIGMPAIFDGPHLELPYIRKVFAESWIFRDLERSPADGWKFSEKIPDSITSWSVMGFSLNPNTGLSLTKNSTKVKVYQDFFISFDLPSFIYTGEEVDIPVYIYNYFQEDVMAKVKMECLNNTVEVQNNHVISKLVLPHKSEKIIYRIRAKKHGQHIIAVTAMSSLASDAVHKTLKVKAEGVPHSFSKTYLVHFLQESEQKILISLDIPDNAIQGSETIHLSAVGHLLGTLIKKLNELVRVPYGNSEENLNAFVANLLVLKYLRALNHSIPIIEINAKQHLECSYQTLMTTKHMDGSFGFVDRKISSTGDIWITAHVIRALQQAKSFIYVNKEQINRGLKYLETKQAYNGGFDSAKGVDDDVTLTSFIMLAFLAEKERKNTYQNVVAKGLAFLHDSFDNVENTSSKALAAYALQLGKHGKTGELFTKLRNHAATETQVMWTKPDDTNSKLKTLAHSFIKILESHEKFMETLFPIVRFIISTESVANAVHIVALDTMVDFAKEMKLASYDIEVNFRCPHGKTGDFHITSDNSAVVQRAELEKETRNVRLKIKGKGFALIELKYTYNLAPENNTSPLYQTNVTLIEPYKFKSTLRVCVAIKLEKSQNNNSTLLKVNLQTGISVEESSFDVIKWQIKQVKLIHFQSKDNLIFIIIENISHNGICIPIELIRKFDVNNKKPVSVEVFQGHTGDKKSEEIYYE